MCILGGPPAHNFSTVVPNGIAWKPQAPHATEGLNMDPIKGGKNMFGPTIESKIPSNWFFRWHPTHINLPQKSYLQHISHLFITVVIMVALVLSLIGSCVQFVLSWWTVVDSALVDTGQWASWWKVGLSRQSRVECWCFQILSILSPAFVPTTAAAWRVLIFSRLSPLFWESAQPTNSKTKTSINSNKNTNINTLRHRKAEFSFSIHK